MILMSSVHFSYYNFSTVAQILRPSSGCMALVMVLVATDITEDNSFDFRETVTEYGLLLN